jgi:membrane-anchored glycerophosphoryl diester phosphodiesterase (GDPDase)
LRIYRDRFKLYLGLALKALLWSFVPIYGWAKSFQIQAIISRHVFQELTNQPESVSTTRTQLNRQLWSFWVAQILIGLIAFGINLALTIVSVIIIGLLTAVLGGGSSAEASLLLVLLQNIINLITLVIYFWFYSHFFVAELPLAIEKNVTSTSCISRSWELTKGLVVRVQLIVFVAGLITAPIVLLALSPLFLMISSLITSSSPEALVFAIIPIIFWGLILLTVGNAFMMPFWQAIKAVIYYDLRSRREGLGLQVRDSRSR